MPGDSLHDATVERLATQLRELLEPAAEYRVLTRAWCQLLDGFPTCLTLFDIAVVDPNPRWITAPNGKPVLDPDSAPILAVNVVDAATLSEDTIAIPNTLARTAVGDYVMFDPTGAVMRPALQAVVKGEGEMLRSWPAQHGVFFSGVDVRLDIRGTNLFASRCGRADVEEELFVLKWERERLDPSDPARRGHDGRIARLESRLDQPRTPRGEE